MKQRDAFTLVELLVVITIIAILSSLMLVAMFGAQEGAKAQRTRSLIAKLDEVIAAQYEQYRARAISIQADSVIAMRGWNVPPYNGTSHQRKVAKARLDALRELQAFEMPDRWSDIGVLDAMGNAARITPISGITRPSVYESYFRRYAAAVSKAKAADPSNYASVVKNFEQAETLHLVITMFIDDGLDFFRLADAGDLDGDGAKEFHDGWGRPIGWLRWPAGFDSTMNRIIMTEVTTDFPPKYEPIPKTTTFSGQKFLSRVVSDYSNCYLKFTTGDLRGTMYRCNYSIYDNETPANEADDIYLFTVPGNLTVTPKLNYGDRFHIIGPDRFDARHVYPPKSGDFWGVPPPPPNPHYQPGYTFEIHPLIFSTGPDNEPGMAFADFSYSSVNNNPYTKTSAGVFVGQQNYETGEYLDNITNQDPSSRR